MCEYLCFLYTYSKPICIYIIYCTSSITVLRLESFKSFILKIVRKHEFAQDGTIPQDGNRSLGKLERSLSAVVNRIRPIGEEREVEERYREIARIHSFSTSHVPGRFLPSKDQSRPPPPPPARENNNLTIICDLRSFPPRYSVIFNRKKYAPSFFR